MDRKPADDPVNAFVSRLEIEGAADGPLSGLTFVAKDIYDVAGHITGCGSPDWARSHPPADANAPIVDALLKSGAKLIGKTHTDEIAYSLMGANAHYGTPINTRAPDRVPGGSSSGSAAASAAGLADIGLGSDTGGSVRLPASFCGLYGIRTTHGRIDLAGTMPLAPSYDVAGWFADRADIFAAAGSAFAIPEEEVGPTRLMLPVDAWATADADVTEALSAGVDSLQSHYGPLTVTRISEVPLVEWRETFRITQAAEIWQVHRDWVETVHPSFGPGVKERFEMAKAISPDEAAAAGRRREIFRQALRRKLGQDGFLVMPTSPAPAPRRDAADDELNDFRGRALQLLAPAGIAGLPQVNLPFGTVGGAPVGLSLIGPPGADGRLLAMVRAYG